VASRGRRLGPFLSTLLTDLLEVLDQTPAPRGAERGSARALADWCAERWPDLDWRVQPYGADGANLVVEAGPGPVLYSHLDTSLNGIDCDGMISGRLDDPGPLRIDGDLAEGFGLGVARAPAAAALAAFVNVRRGTLLLAGSGTHRRGGRAEGVEAFLDSLDALPTRAIVAKGGPATVLHEEPGAAYARITLRGVHGAGMMPGSASPAGGVIAHAGVLLEAVAAWRERYRASRSVIGQVGPEVSIGGIRAGHPDKADLLPATLVLDLYVVTVPGESAARLATVLRTALLAGLSGTPLAECALGVDVDWAHDAAATPVDDPFVEAAHHAWEEVFGSAPEPITGWTGSTDGVVFRERGMATVRVGPQSVRSVSDARRDVVDLAELARYQRLYEALLEPFHEH